MNEVKDLEVLSKYLSEEELKDIAKDVAYNHFSSKLKESNPHAKSNLEFYIGQGALQAVQQYGHEIDFDFHAQELKDKTSKLIKGLRDYNLPDNYQEIAKQTVEEHREEIQNRMKEKIAEFVNGDKYPSLYSTFEQCVGEQLGDLLYSMLEEKFKTK